MKNVVKSPKHFFGYFNTLETHSVMWFGENFYSNGNSANFFAKLQFAGLSQSFMQILNFWLSGSPSTMFSTKLNIAFWTKYLIVVTGKWLFMVTLHTSLGQNNKHDKWEAWFSPLIKGPNPGEEKNRWSRLGFACKIAQLIHPNLGRINCAKAELPLEGISFCTQFPYLGIFINKKVGNWKN